MCQSSHALLNYIRQTVSQSSFSLSIFIQVILYGDSDSDMNHRNQTLNNGKPPMNNGKPSLNNGKPTMDNGKLILDNGKP